MATFKDKEDFHEKDSSDLITVSTHVKVNKFEQRPVRGILGSAGFGGKRSTSLGRRVLGRTVQWDFATQIGKVRIREGMVEEFFDDRQEVV